MAEAALRLPDRSKPFVRDVLAYYVTIRASRSLIKGAREAGSNKPLNPLIVVVKGLAEISIPGTFRYHLVV